MRITNKIMQNNSLSNINTNKTLQDTLTTQMSTQKKINRPSDDPVIAIRALRLRTNVSTSTQYYSKNIPDANSWLDVTEGALKNTSEVITAMKTQYTKGANGDLTPSDRQIILQQLQALRDEVYSTADVDYAGRYVFAGYRTDVSITFPVSQTMKYDMTEQIGLDHIDEYTYINASNASGEKLVDLTTTNADSMNIVENDVQAFTAHRIRLAYGDIEKSVIPTLTRVTGKDANGDITTEDLVATMTMVHSYDTPSAYELASQNPNNAYYIPETGEIVLGDDLFDTINTKCKDDASTSDVNEGEIRVSYTKSEWKAGDLRPEHYYACTATDEDGEVTEYNLDYLGVMDRDKQVIEYDVGFNQTIRVNTTADEVFDPAIGREVEDAIAALQEVVNLEKIKADMEKALELDKGAAYDKEVRTRLYAIDKALTLANDKMQKIFEGGITAMQKFLDANSIAITDTGTRSSKLKLIDQRMQTQKSTYEALQSENEDIDITEVAIQLESASTTYEAALLATSKVMKTSLLDYI